MACVFRILTGPYRGKIFPVDASRCLTLGNALEADFTIPDSKLLGFHCDVLFDSGRNGRMARIKARRDDALLFVENVPMDEVLLQSGERMRIGNTTMEFLEGGAPQDPAQGRPAKPGTRCASCRRPIPNLGGGRRLLGRAFCWRCVDLRLTVSRELGRYRVLRKIDRGIAEITYAAEDLTTGDPPERVALHVLKSERQGEPHVLRRFLTKAVFAYSLDHPVFAFTRDLIHREEVASYVTELTEWSTLQEWLLEGRSFPFHVATRIAMEMSEGLRFARERGMVVGRIRPGRLLVSEEGRVQVKSYWLKPELEERIARGIGAPEVDPLPFGGSQGGEEGLDPETGMSNDLLHYLVPPAKDVEHYRDETRDVRAVGILWFELCTAQHPGDRQVTALAEAMQAAHVKTRTRGKPRRIPSEVRAVLGHTLAASSKLRYQTLTELAEVLRGLYMDF